MMKSLRIVFTVIFLSLSIISCSGGGGGGGDSESASNDGSNRTTGTGVRIINASLDSEPVDLRIANQYFNRASFMQVNFYSAVKSGATNLILERANSPEVVITTLSQNLLPKTEYSILLYGEHVQGNFNVSIIEEPIVRPEIGQVRLQFVNLLNDSSSLTLNGAVADIGPITFGNASGYVIISTPVNTVQTFSINNSKRTVANVTVEFIDRGENTVVIGGSQSKGVIITRVFKDLD